MSLKPFLLGFVTAAFAVNIQAETTIEHQRATYQKISQLMSISKSQPTLALVEQLLATLQGYPLAPYVEYRLLKENPELDLAKINQFLQQNTTLPVENNLKNQWNKNLIEKQDWKTLSAQYSAYPEQIAERCHYLQAKYYTQTQIDITTWKEQVQTLWLTEENLPAQCDAVITLWQKLMPMRDELWQQRVLLAVEKKNVNLLSQLQTQVSDPIHQKWINQIIELVKEPYHLPYFAESAVVNSHNQQILTSIFPQYVKTLKDDLLPKENPFAPFEIWANKFSLTPEQIKAWKFAFISQIFDTEIPELQQWRDQQLQQLKDDRLLERRIRMAIWQKTDITIWLDQLSQQTQEKDEWKYWRAKTIEKTDKKQANKLWQAMATGRGFYPMLASAELNQEYQPTFATFSFDPQAPIEQRYPLQLARIAELRLLNETATLNLEWKSLMEKASLQDKLALSQYAATQQWFDLAVDATIQAQAWDYIALRLPNAYLPWFDLHLNNKKIHRTFAMAIARQESAWRPAVASSANARGLMQLLPSTAKLTADKFNLPYSHENQLNDPFNNIMLGCAHLQELYDRFGDNRILIAAAYNAGINRVTKWLERSNGQLSMAEFVASIPFYETRGYVQNVLAYDYYYQLLQGLTPRKFSKDEYDRLY